eukprot:TRINITY_DN473_c0_g1_i1.p1 TRINITY_DN473_c0_g1~~TRINITY_DN473_c0_g1_i1.p1  ORF type:complete len:1365 (+),score=470.87 TRINITY_DN473_c0_g1_i1:137-4231(+)
MQSRGNSQDSFNAAKGRTKSQVRFAVEEEVERHSSNSLDKLSLSNTNGNSPMIQNAAPSNPNAKMNRARTISKTFSSLELQFKLQQQDKYDTTVMKLGKATFAIFVMIVGVAAMILGKTSMLHLADFSQVGNSREFRRYIFAILFITVAPLFLTLLADLLYFWVRETKEKKKDPKAKIVRPHAIMFLALLEGLVESCGYGVFIMLVLPAQQVDVFSKLFLLNGLCVIPVICGIVSKWRKWLSSGKKRTASMSHSENDMELHDMESGEIRSEKKKDGADFCSRIVVTGVQILFLLMQMAGIGLLVWHTKMWWEIPVALVLTSIAWWKNFVFIDRLEPHWADAFKRHRYASSLIKTVTKIVMIIIVVIIIMKFKYSIDPATVFEKNFIWSVLKTSSGLHYALLGSYVAFFMVWLACLACLQVFCVALPVLLATPLSLLYQTWSCKYYIYGFPLVGCETFIYQTLRDNPIQIAAGALLWVSFIIITGHLWAGVDKRDANQMEEDMWAQPEGINCIFVEQNLALNRNRNPKVVKALDGDIEYGFHAHRTYITTTMYHESKVEMMKLVMSLLAIDAEIPTEDKVADYYECHIIFDDAFLKSPVTKLDANHIDWSPYYNGWVFYLIEIIQELKLKKLGEPVVVWYGEVLTFKFSLGMKLVVHLKDVSKIKQKKRWSQILYMHSILEDVLDNENKLGMLDSNTFILMIDGDTQFTRKAVNMMRHMAELDREKTGAVCGRIFPEGSSNPIVWYQKFEYAVGHWFQKTAEHVFGTVLCCPGCFSLVRCAALYRRSGEAMDGENATIAIEKYSVDVVSAMDVLKFDQGEDRMLSTLIVMHGWRLQYCAGAEAGTFCPEGFGDFFKQRRRWVSSTLANLYFLLSAASDIIKINTSVSAPFILYTGGVFASSLFGPATIILVVIGGFGYAFGLTGTWPNLFGAGLPALYGLLMFFFNLDMETDTPRKKSKKIDIQIAGAFILCAIYAILMAAVAIGIAAQLVSEPKGPDAIYFYSLVGTFVVCAFLHGEFLLLVHGLTYLFLLPTMYLILIMFAIANLHDQAWGTRDSSSGAKETDADKFISITKIGAYITGMRNGWREAVYDKKPKTKEEIEKEKASSAWKETTEYWDDDGKEEIIMLEEERRRIEEEKKKQEEEKKKQEEERALREIERQKEEAKKKRQEAEERERLQERLKQERRRGINHRYKDMLSSLSRRLKNRVVAPEKGNEKDVAEEKLEKIRQLAALQQMCCFMLTLITVVWLILVITVGLHPELKVIGTNSVGLLFLMAFGLIQVLQFAGSIIHRLETMFNALANIPMSVDCAVVDEGSARRFEKMKQLRMNSENEPTLQKEGVAAKVARKLLMVDKRTATKANLFG